MSQNWYAVYTRPRGEKKVADLLNRKKIESYCPLNKVTKQWSDRKKTILEPLFKSYVFVKASESQLDVIRQVDGVINLVHWLGKPAIFKDVDFDTIRQFLSEYSNVKLERVEVNMNDMVRIVSNPLAETASYDATVQGKVIKLILPSLGYLLTAEIESTQVLVINRREALEKSNPAFKYSYR